MIYFRLSNFVTKTDLTVNKKDTKHMKAYIQFNTTKLVSLTSPSANDREKMKVIIDCIKLKYIIIITLLAQNLEDLLSIIIWVSSLDYWTISIPKLFSISFKVKVSLNCCSGIVYIFILSIFNIIEV